MKRQVWWVLFLVFVASSSNLLICRSDVVSLPRSVQTRAFDWAYGGCTSGCETGWYSSPAIADLDGDGTMEVIAAAYTLWALNGEDGSVQWQVPSSGGRIWPGVVVADIDADGDLEIVTVDLDTHDNDGYVRVIDHAGRIVWYQSPASTELRGLGVYDLDDDGTLEIVVNGAWGSKINTWVYEHDGKLRSGWPQLANDSGYAAGVYNDSAAIGDLNGKGGGQVIVPSDVHYICAYEANGVQIAAHTMYNGKGWGKVGVWESLDIELRGWGSCDVDDERDERYRTNFASGAAVIADVNGDGAMEVVAIGNVYDCSVGHPPGKYNGVYIFNADRSRFNSDGNDWRSVPRDTGAPLTENYGIIENNQPNPAVADLDGDGEQEILFSSYDGRVHAFWLDKTEHHEWPYSIYDPGDGFYRFGSEPVVVDLDNNGYAEVIVSSWTQKTSGVTGKLHILSYQGTLLEEFDLPGPVGAAWNGALAAPTVANIDADANLEVALNTAHSGVVAYELPGTSQARILWGTGRGNYYRSGSLLYGNLEGSSYRMQPLLPGAGDLLTTTIVLRNSGPILYDVQVTDTLPSQIHYLNNLTASSGSYGWAGDVITWTGIVSAALPVTITFGCEVDQEITDPQMIVNTALIDDGRGNVIQRQSAVIANGYGTYMPCVVRNYAP
ncbi:MAG: VCBS repeat-containing protein [Anaerolineae bacterium]|nr:VCBS repeat-containing protein [Anaerolineae bacterium]